MATLGARAKSARRAAQRRITELNFQLENASTQDVQTSIKRRITRMEELISQTRLYEGGKRIVGRTVNEREAALAELKSLNSEIQISRRSDVAASNRIFKENIRQVSRGSKIDLMTEGSVRSFFRATQEAWERSGSVKDRYKKIQDKYGTTNLQQIYDAATELNSDMLDILTSVESGEQLTTEQKELYGTLMRNDDEMEKRYQNNNEQSPVVGRIAGNIRKMNKSTFNAVTDLMAQRKSGEISEKEYNAELQVIRDSIQV